MKSFLRDESGATAIEYSVIAALMGLALIAAVPLLSSGVKENFANIAGMLDVFR